MTVSFAVPTLSSQNLDTMRQRARQMDYLARDTECTLIHQVQTQGCPFAKKRLVEGHINYITKLAKQYQGYQVDEDDLVQEGVIGLFKAIHNFDTNSENRLNTFARHYILSAFNEYVIRNINIVKIATTKAQRKLFFNLRKLKKGQSLTPQLANEIAENLNVSVDEVWAMDMRLSSYDIPYDMTQSDDETAFDAKSYLFDESDDTEQQIIEADTQCQGYNKLHEAIERLDARSQDVIKSRWLNEEKTPLKTLANKYGISAERIRQVQSQAFEALQAYIGPLH